MASRKKLLAVFTVFSNFFFVSPFSLPHVNPGKCFMIIFFIGNGKRMCTSLIQPYVLNTIGLFVIQGVSTCGHGDGYCLLSNSCLVDTDFEGDIEGGHCDGLKHAFNPHADFVCCKYMPAPTTLTPTTVKTKPPPPPPSDDNTSYSNNSYRLIQLLFLITKKVHKPVHLFLNRRRFISYPRRCVDVR